MKITSKRQRKEGFDQDKLQTALGVVGGYFQLFKIHVGLDLPTSRQLIHLHTELLPTQSCTSDQFTDVMPEDNTFNIPSAAVLPVSHAPTVVPYQLDVASPANQMFSTVFRSCF